MIPHSWFVKCLRMFGAAENMVLLLERNMNQWQVELSAKRRTLGSINVRKGIFQGDCLSPLLFVFALIPLSMVLRRVKVGYDLTSRKGFLSHLLFMVDLNCTERTRNK